MHAVQAAKNPDIYTPCERCGLSHLEPFGLAVGSDFDPESSDDHRIAQLHDHAARSSMRQWHGLADALETLRGRHVDVVNPRTIESGNSHCMWRLRRSGVTAKPILQVLAGAAVTAGDHR